MFHPGTSSVSNGYPYSRIMNVDTEHITVVDPIYIKHADLQYINSDIAVQLCQAADRVIDSSAVGAQKYRGVWSLFVKSKNAKQQILEEGITIQNESVELFAFNPFESRRPISTETEMIVFKNIPLSDSEGNILINNYMREYHPNITVTSDVCYSRIKSGNRKTEYRSGDRFVLVESGFSPSLPENTQIGQYNVRVWHRSQEVFCKRCNTANLHKTTDVTKCENYRPDTEHLVTFKDDWNILSNFFMCKVSVFGKIFKSAEHAYQWKKCMDCLKEELANQVFIAPTPQRAKQIASRIDGLSLSNWKRASGHIVVMSEVLIAKSRSNIDFHTTLLKTNDKQIVEATLDTTWGCGLPPLLAATVKTFPGKNLCGTLLMELRSELQSQHTVAPPTMQVDITIPPPSIDLATQQPPSPPPFPPPSTPLVYSPNNDQACSSNISLNSTRKSDVITDGGDASSDICDNDVTKTPPTNKPRSPSLSLPTTPLKACSDVLTLDQLSKKDPPQSPLMGKLIFRRYLTPRQLQVPKKDSDDDSDSDMATELEYGWPNWDRDSIASEITNAEDCDIVFQ